ADLKARRTRRPRPRRSADTTNKEQGDAPSSDFRRGVVVFRAARHHVRMATLLLKTEPGEYSWGDLVREKRCVWTGVTNNAAQKAMREAKEGDEALLYHTGDEKRIVGLAA